MLTEQARPGKSAHGGVDGGRQALNVDLDVIVDVVMDGDLDMNVLAVVDAMRRQRHAHFRARGCPRSGAASSRARVLACSSCSGRRRGARTTRRRRAKTGGCLKPEHSSGLGAYRLIRQGHVYVQGQGSGGERKGMGMFRGTMHGHVNGQVSDALARLKG